MARPIIELTKDQFRLARVELLDAWKALETASDRFVAAVKSDVSFGARRMGRKAIP